MKKKIFTLLALFVCAIGTAWGDTVIYSWEGGANGATETGGTVSVLGSDDAINATTNTINGTYYVIKVASKKANVSSSHTQIVLNSSLQEGDQIKISGFQNKNATDKTVSIYLKFLDGSTEKGDISDSENWGNMYNDTQYATINEPETKTFNVTSTLAGSNTIYITRNSSGTNLWISKIEIVRPTSKAATPSVTLGNYDTSTNTYAVTLSCTTDGATIHYSTDNKASYTDYSAALALAPGTTVDAYATKTGMDNSDAMEQYTVPAAPTEWTLTFANAEGATGFVPAAADVTIGESFTLPANFTMYKDGYTLTGWNDGDNTYATGASYTPDGNKTLTAVYTQNTVSLEDRSSAVTIKWMLGQGAGMPAGFSLNGTAGFIVTQATVNGSKIDVKLPIDATSGKFTPSTNQWAQVNSGTKFNVPSANGAVVSYSWYNTTEGASPNTGEESIDRDADETEYELTISNEAATNGKFYLSFVQVVLPALPLGTVANFKFTAKSDWNTSNYQTVGKIKATFSNDAQNDYVKFAKGNTLTLDVTGDYVITKVELGYVSSSYTPAEKTITTTVGSMNDAGTLWTGSAHGLVITNSATGSNDARVNMLKVTYVPAISTDINAYEWTTFVSDIALDFTNSDVKAYVVTGHTGTAINKNNDVKKVPANTPLLLNAPEGTYYIPVTDDPGTITTNLLKAGTGAEVGAVDGKTRYVLSLDDDNKIAFLKIASEPATVPVGKAYLEFDEVIAAPSFSFGDATSIDNVRGKKEDIQGEVYNLAGQRVAQPTKGLYIVNGKKVIIK